MENEKKIINLDAMKHLGSFFHHMNYLDFELCRNYGTDIGLLMAIINSDLFFCMHPKENPDSGFIFLNNHYWYKFNLKNKINYLPLWSFHKAKEVFQSLIDFGLIMIIGNVKNDDEILILLMK